MSGGGSMNYGTSSSGNQSQFGQDVWNMQSPHLLNMYRYAGNQMNAPGHTLDNSYALANARMGGDRDRAVQYQAQMARGGFNDPALRQSIMDSMNARSNMGTMYESIVGGSGNSYADPLIESARNDMLKNYNMTSGGGGQMELGAAASGQSGSARHGVQDFMSKNALRDDMQGMENQIRYDSYAPDLQMKMGIAQQADQNRLASQQQGINMLNQKNDMLSQAMNFSPQMQMMSGTPWDITRDYQNVPWENLANYANVLGQPTVLNSGSSSGWSKGRQMGMSGHGGAK